MRYKAGDIVRVRDWDDMFKEFGTTAWGSVNTSITFPYSMKVCCGREYEINKVKSYYYELKGAGNWCFSDDMLVPAGTGKDKVMKIDFCKIFGVKPDQVFQIKVGNLLFEDEYRIHENVLQFHSMIGSWEQSVRRINEFYNFEVVLYSATEDEKTILRNLDEKYRKKGNIYRLTTGELRIVVRTGCYEDFCFPYSDLFQFIQQDDNYEIPIRDIIGE